MSQLEHLDLDPVEKSWSQECQAAWRQYDALMKYVADPKGMPKLVETDRWQEYHSRRSGTTGRILDAVLHRGGKLSPTQMAQLKQWREEEWARRTPPPTGSPAVASADALVTAHRPGTGAGGQ
jgi:hypothetical protein